MATPTSSPSSVHFRFPLLLADDFRQILDANSDAEELKDWRDRKLVENHETSMFNRDAPFGYCVYSPASSTIRSMPWKCKSNAAEAGECTAERSNVGYSGNWPKNAAYMDSILPSRSPAIPSLSTSGSSGEQFTLPSRKILMAHMAERSVLARMEGHSEYNRTSPPHPFFCFASETDKVTREERNEVGGENHKREGKEVFFPSTKGGQSSLSSLRHWETGADEDGLHSSQYYIKNTSSASLLGKQVGRFLNELSLLWSRDGVIEQAESNQTHSSASSSHGHQGCSIHFYTDGDADNPGPRDLAASTARRSRVQGSLSCDASSRGSNHGNGSHDGISKEERRQSSELVKPREREEVIPPRHFLEEMGYYAHLLCSLIHTTSQETTAFPTSFRDAKTSLLRGEETRERVTSLYASHSHIPLDTTERKVVEGEGEENNVVGKKVCTPSSTAITSFPHPFLLSQDSSPSTDAKNSKAKPLKEDKRRKKKGPCSLAENESRKNEESKIILRDKGKEQKQEFSEGKESCSEADKSSRDYQFYPTEQELPPSPLPQQQTLQERDKYKDCLATKDDLSSLISRLHSCFLNFLCSLSPCILRSEGGEWVEWWLSFPFLCSGLAEWRVGHEEEETEKELLSNKSNEEITRKSSPGWRVSYHRHLQRTHVRDMFHLLTTALRQWCVEVSFSPLSSPPRPLSMLSPRTPYFSLPRPSGSASASSFAGEASERSFFYSSPLFAPSTDSAGVGRKGTASEENKSVRYSFERKHHNSFSNIMKDKICERSEGVSLLYALHAIAFHYHRCFGCSGGSTHAKEEKVITREAAAPVATTTTTTSSSGRMGTAATPVASHASSLSSSSCYSSWRMLHALCDAMIQVITALPLSYLLPPSSPSHGGTEQFFFRHFRPGMAKEGAGAGELPAELFSSFPSPLAPSHRRAPYRALFSVALGIIIEVHQLHHRGKGHTSSEKWKSFTLPSSQTFVSRMHFLQEVYHVYSSNWEAASGGDGSPTTTGTSVGSLVTDKQKKNGDIFDCPEYCDVFKAIQKFSSLTG